MTRLSIPLLLAALALSACGSDTTPSQSDEACDPGSLVRPCEEADSTDVGSASDAVTSDDSGVDDVGATEDSDGVFTDVGVDSGAADDTGETGDDIGTGGGTGAGADSGDDDTGGAATGTTDRVVDAAWLIANLDDVQVIDVRGSGSFAAGHISGALLLDGGTLRGTVDGVSSQSLPLDDIAAELAAVGVDPDLPILVVGDGVDTTSARVVWTIANTGHAHVALLDGGMPAWEDAGGLTEAGAFTATPSAYSQQSDEPVFASDADQVLAFLDDPTVALVDARSAGEFEAGHIPGAVNVDWTTNVAGGAYRALDAVRDLYAAVADADHVVAYCQSGSRASVAWVTLSWLGYSTTLYDGSWAEWGSLPAATYPREP